MLEHVQRVQLYIFNFIRRDQNDSSKTIIKSKNNINENKQSTMNTDTKIIMTHI